ncbi:MAG: hypothetical protein U5P10_13560 [Spirochaetia bacterium]|nr:hypothetical protein [Spirochaetia bacterium]
MFTYGGTSKLAGLYGVKDIQWLSVAGAVDYTMTQMQNNKFLSRVGLSGVAQAGSSAARVIFRAWSGRIH